MRAATNEERGWQVLGDWFDQVLQQPVVKTGLAIADIAGKAFDAGIRGQVGREDLQVGNQTIPADEQKVAAMVYHGSPHSFQKFDMSKIGTGEGAQAYGHGLYFADSPGVAEQYRKQLSQADVSILGQQQPVPSWSADLSPQPWTIRALADARSTNPKATEAEIVDHVRQRILPDLQSRDNAVVNAAKNKLDFLQAATERQLTTTIQGGTYTVDLPDDAIAKMLDWDAPLNQQPWLPKGSPQEIIARVNAEGRQPTLLEQIAVNAADPRSEVSQMTGQQLYKDLARKFGRKNSDPLSPHIIPSETEAARVLREAGIPGIKYFDGSSRAAGKGSRNYVVFSDDLPTIKAVNGVPLSQVGGIR